MPFYTHLRNIVKPLLYSFATLAGICQVTADQLFLDAYLTNGYRQDKLSYTSKLYNPSGDLLLTRHFKTSTLEMYQAGMKGYYATCGWQFRADGSYAWANSGRTDDNFREPSYTMDHRSFVNKIKSAKTTDFTVGGGWDIGLLDCISVVPMGGVSYHSQRIHMKNNRFDASLSLSDQTYISRFKGPWIGGDAIFRLEGFQLRGGYEYHFATWHGNSFIKVFSSSVHSIGDSRHSNHARGQVVYGDVHYQFCNAVELGVGVKYQQWKVHGGSIKPRLHVFEVSSSSSSGGSGSGSSSGSSSGSGSSEHRQRRRHKRVSRNQSEEFVSFPAIKHRIKTCNWDSLVITLDVGCSF